LPAFLAFQDELMRRFFTIDAGSYLRLGRDSSRWAVGDGPLKELLAGKDLGHVVGLLPSFHGMYFKEAATWSEASLTDTGVEFKVHELPEWHPYFEHFVVGYMAEILEMYCANPIRTVRLRGGAGRQYHYLLHGAPADEAEKSSSENRKPESEGRKPPSSKGEHSLSNREIEVLLLAAHGKTNEEIGSVLGISRKTAQHHLANTYRKIGVSGRVGATVWLAERGLIGN
jgi:DNA-binding CsgD family transcriptional regulator